ncbi:MAG TPA: hypothetical protein VF665_17870 [Longimicrobium sp.]|jgi:hypothetical protein|uniref:hypothetical protein n=1 Tax=Longimicrobium sp. TaxID=2029185 RepID=UPI002EDA5597
MTRLLPRAALLACALPLASCGRDARAAESRDQPSRAEIPVVAGAELVAGFWRGGDESVELFGNGTVLLYRWPGRVVGRYQFVTPDRMLIDFPFTGTVPGDYRVAREPDVLRLCETDRPERCIRLERVERTAEGTVVRASATPSGLAPAPDFNGPRPPEMPVYGEGPPRLATRPSVPPPEARAAEPGPMLKQIRTLQESYRLEYGRYAATLDSLPGWEVPRLRWYHPPVLRSAAPGWMCVDMLPRDRDLWPVHILNDGQPGRGTCAEQR